MFRTDRKYLIISGGILGSSESYCLTCSNGIKKDSEMKFSVNMEDAIKDERCHFSFEENNNIDKEDYFKYYIKSSHNDDLFLSYGYDTKMSLTMGVNIKVILNDGYSDGYKYSFDIKNEDFCNYKIQGIYYDSQYKTNKYSYN